jgi:hypothetical protein
VTSGGGTSGAGVAGANAAKLAQTGTGPVAAEGFLGALLAMIGVALLKPREILRKLSR